MPVGYVQTVHTWMFGEMPFEQILSHLRAAGAGGLDLSIAAEGPASAKALLCPEKLAQTKACGLPVYSTTPLFFSPDTDLASADEGCRQKAVAFSKRAAEVTTFYQCDKMLISPSWVSVLHQLEQPYTAHWGYAVKAVRQVARHAAGLGVTLLIEPINRYRVSLVHTIAEGLRFIAEVGEPNLALVGDVFHMHMEEPNGVVNAIHQAGSRLKCLHIGDATRRCPGYGTTDWREILAALAQIGFEGPLAYEPAELYFSAALVAADPQCADAFTLRLKNGMAYLAALMERL